MKKEALNTMDIRRKNRARVMSILINEIETTRNDLRKATDFSYSTIGNILNDLFNGDYIYESKQAPSTGGRKSQIISINYNNFLFLSVDLTFYDFHWAIHDLRGEIIFENYYTYTHESGIKENYEKIAEEIYTTCKSKIDLSKICYLGIAIPGYYDEENDKIIEFFSEEFEKIRLKEIFSKYFSVPITIRNDANTAAINEIKFHDYYSDHGKKCVIYFLVSELGVGSAIIYNNNLFAGSKGYAGESFILPVEYDGKIHKFGELISPESDMGSLSGKLQEKVDKRRFFELYEEKNEAALEIYNKNVAAFSNALIQIINLLNPSDIIISGFYCAYGHEMIDDIYAQIKENVKAPKLDDFNITYSNFSDKTIIMGLYKTMINEWVNDI